MAESLTLVQFFQMLVLMLVEISLRLMVIPLWCELIDTNKLKSNPIIDMDELDWSWTTMVDHFERHRNTTNSGKYAWVIKYGTVLNVLALGMEVFIGLFQVGLFMMVMKTCASSLSVDENLMEVFGGILGMLFHFLTRYVRSTRLRYYILIAPLINVVSMICLARLRSVFGSSSFTTPNGEKALDNDTNSEKVNAIMQLSPELAGKYLQALVTSYGSQKTIRLHALIQMTQSPERYRLLSYMLRWQYVEIWIRSETTGLVSRVSDAYKRFHPQEYEDCRDSKRTTIELSRKGFHNYDSYQWVNDKVSNIVALFEESKDGNIMYAIQALDNSIQGYQASRPSWHVLKRNAHKHFIEIVDNHIAGVLAIPIEEVQQLLKVFITKP